MDDTDTNLVSHETGHVNRLAGVILGERLDTPTEGFWPFLGKKTLGPVAGRLEFTMRHTSEIINTVTNIYKNRAIFYIVQDPLNAVLVSGLGNDLDNGVLLI